MSSKNDILTLIRRPDLPAAPLPELEGDWITYPDRQEQFRQVLEAIGGTLVVAEGSEAIARTIRELPFFSEAQQIVCTAGELDLGNLDLAGLDDPHQLADVDLAILPGELAVAENGAVWVTDAEVPLRAVYFLTQHLVLVLPREAIVDNMHQAYQRLSLGQRGFGTFISGPSKTADIEQSLVIGAHGARSTTVILT